MTPRRSTFLVALCAMAVAGAGCGGGDDDSNKALSYDDTGTKISEICDTVTFKGATGDPKNDAPILAKGASQLETAIDDINALDVADELKATRDQFTSLGEQQLAIVQEAQKAAEAGDEKAYKAAAKKAAPLDKQSDALASKLGATGCTEDN